MNLKIGIRKKIISLREKLIENQRIECESEANVEVIDLFKTFVYSEVGYTLNNSITY